MNRNTFWAALGKALAIVTVTFIVVVTLAPSTSAASKFKTVYKFTGGADGSQPLARLILDAAGNLYGTTYVGGAGWGTVFELTPNADGSWTETVLHSFTCDDDGFGPVAGLVLDATGNLYGTASVYGTRLYGAVFQLTPHSERGWTKTELHSFGGWDGNYPFADLIFDQAGKLYGITHGGGNSGAGQVYELTPNGDGSWAESSPHFFNVWDGVYPYADLIFDEAGNLHGTTYQGGNLSACSGQGCGVVFKVMPNPDESWTASVLHSFSGADGSNPLAGLIFDTAGNLYGTAEVGGLFGHGVVFKLRPNPDGTWSERVLHQFTGGKDGGEPFGGLIFDKAGNLYGTTYQGGSLTACSGDGCGVVFKLTPKSNGGWKEAVLHRFVDHPGARPSAGLILDAAGNLYGTTAGDGTATFGSVFEITP